MNYQNEWCHKRGENDWEAGKTQRTPEVCIVSICSGATKEEAKNACDEEFQDTVRRLQKRRKERGV